MEEIMGVDYDGVGGIGIEFTDEMVEKVIKQGVFTEEDWADDWTDCMEKIGICYSEAGDYSYGGEKRIYLLVEGSTLDDIISNEEKFREDLSKLGITVERKDLKVIEDLCVW
jgi:hypothetical protein